MRKTILSDESKTSIDRFSNHVNKATKDMFGKWNSEGYY